MSHPHPERAAPADLPAGGLRVIPLGGLGEVGRNMTVIEHEGRLLIVDCGVLFPDDHQPGVDLILPDDLSDTPVEMPVGLAVAALRNLLDNALRHTPGDPRGELSVLMAGDQVVFRVRDHGQQIASEDLQYLTQRFWRNGNSEGCGLGLAIVQAIVQRCSCSLTFDSQPDGLRVDLGMPLRR